MPCILRKRDVTVSRNRNVKAVRLWTDGEGYYSLFPVPRAPFPYDRDPFIFGGGWLHPNRWMIQVQEPDGDVTTLATFPRLKDAAVALAAMFDGVTWHGSKGAVLAFAG